MAFANLTLGPLDLVSRANSLPHRTDLRHPQNKVKIESLSRKNSVPFSRYERNWKHCVFGGLLIYKVEKHLSKFHFICLARRWALSREFKV